MLNTTMGRYSYCGHDSQVVCCNIGAFCSISDHVYIGGPEHPMEWVSTSPVFQNVRHSGPPKRFARFEIDPIKTTTIGNDVWIGAKSIVMDGVTIGDGAIVAAGSVVTKDVPPYAIVGGAPAKVIKYRFPPEMIDRLLDIKWWNLPDEDITKALALFHKPNPTLDDINKFFPQ